VDLVRSRLATVAGAPVAAAEPVIGGEGTHWRREPLPRFQEVWQALISAVGRTQGVDNHHDQSGAEHNDQYSDKGLLGKYRDDKGQNGQDKKEQDDIIDRPPSVQCRATTGKPSDANWDLAHDGDDEPEAGANDIEKEMG